MGCEKLFTAAIVGDVASLNEELERKGDGNLEILVPDWLFLFFIFYFQFGGCS